MWKVYRSSRIFNQTLLPSLKLPNQTMGSLSAWFEETALIVRKGNGKREITNTGFIPCSDFGICVKKYVPRNSLGIISRRYLLWRRKKMYDRYKKVFNIGIPTPEPYACLCGYDDRGPLSIYIISRKLEDMEEFGIFLGQEHLKTEKKLRVFASLGRIIGDLHSHGYTHGDAYGGNIMVNEREIFLIDMDSIRRPLLPASKFARDIARFIANFPKEKFETDKDMHMAIFLFFANYCTASGAEASKLVIKVHQSLNNLEKNCVRERSEKGEKELHRIRSARDMLQQLGL